MAKRVSLAVCLTLGVAFIVGAGCSSIPDHRKTLGSDSVDGGGAGGGESRDGGGDTGGTGATGSGGASGTGARAGAGGKGGSSGSGTSGAGGAGQGGSGGVISIDGGDGGGAVGIPCGKNVCPDRTVGRETFPACCAGPNADRCGLDTTFKDYAACVEYLQPGVVDDVCEQVTDSMDFVFTGCCRPDGKCGAFFGYKAGPNFGCVDPQDLGAPAAQDCTPAECKAAGTDCQNNSDCCPGPAGDPVCVTISQDSGPKCSDFCTNNRDCTSGCCILLVSGRGACADASECGDRKLGEREIDDTCDVDADCTGGAACAPNSDYGPRLCEVKCMSNATCAPEFCVKDERGRGACSSGGTGLCTDTCRKANNGTCDDMDSSGFYSDCTLGTDCSDCGGTTKFGRVGGTALCFRSCNFDGNGKCEDGGPNAVSGACDLGTDCTDCGSRLGICLNTCADAFDGECDDGGPGSTSSACNLGTDCVDCGIRFGGRGQGVCDGTTGTICVPHGGVDNDAIEDGTCECADCAWDAVDCKVATKCDGKALGTCCAQGNLCKLQSDGICSCGGWCDWEAPDCGEVFPTPFCDGSISEGCDFSTPDLTLQKNGKCDCQGACSWEQDCTTLTTLCKDTCKSANNFSCDDDDLVCPYGTDCADCGPRYPR